MSSLAEVVKVIKETNQAEAARKKAADDLAIANENTKFDQLNETLKKTTDENKQAQIQATIALIEETRTARKASEDNRSNAKKNLDDNKQGLEALRKEIEDNGGKAESNLKFQKAANKIRREELALQKQNATNPSQRKEIAKDQRKAQFDAIKLAFAPVTGRITNLVGIFSKVAGFKTGIPGLTVGRLALLALIPVLIQFLRSPAWKDLKEKLLSIDPEEATGVIGGIVKGALGVIRFIGYIGKGFKNVISLFTGNTNDENGEPVGKLKFLIDNIGSMLAAIGVLGALFAPSLLFATIRVGGKAVFGLGKWLIFKPIQAAFNSLFKALGLLATQADDIATTTFGAAAKGVKTKPLKGASYKTAAGKTVTFTGKDFVDDAGNTIKGGAANQLKKGIASGAVQSADDAQGNIKKISKRFPRLQQLFSGPGRYVLKALPFLGTALSVGMGAKILLSDAPRDQKVTELGGLLAGTLGASGLAILGGVGGGFFGGPIGAILGSVGGGLLGFIGGDFAGRQLASFLLGGDVNLPSSAPTGVSPGAMGGQQSSSQVTAQAVNAQQLATDQKIIGSLPPKMAAKSLFKAGRLDLYEDQFSVEDLPRGYTTKEMVRGVDTFSGEGMGGSAIINTGGNVSNVTKKTIAPTTIVNKDPVLNLIGNSLAM